MKFTRAVFDRKAFWSWVYSREKNPGAEQAAEWMHDTCQHQLETAFRQAADAEQARKIAVGERDAAVLEARRARAAVRPLEERVQKLERSLDAAVEECLRLQKGEGKC